MTISKTTKGTSKPLEPIEMFRLAEIVSEWRTGTCYVSHLELRGMLTSELVMTFTKADYGRHFDYRIAINRVTGEQVDAMKLPREALGGKFKELFDSAMQKVLSKTGMPDNNGVDLQRATLRGLLRNGLPSHDSSEAELLKRLRSLPVKAREGQIALILSEMDANFAASAIILGEAREQQYG